MAMKLISRNKLPSGVILLMSVLFLYKYIEIESQDDFPIIVDNAEDYIDIATFKSRTRSVAELKEFINRHNKHPKVMNNRLRRCMSKYLAVIVIQVRSNIISIVKLINTLKETVGIKNSLVIFSHATYDDDINEIIKNISFTRYIQILYPYSTQVYRKTFPGDDLQFCKDDLTCEANNGRRNATEVQKKHHWWWTVNYVFEHLKPIEHYQGTVVFLEEDQYVVKDFIYILNTLEYSQKAYCPYCKIFSLAVSKPNITNYEKPSLIKIKDLGFFQDLMGIGFNRTVWTEIKNLTDYFCSFNDVEWTHSLVYSLMKTSNKPYAMLSINGPRVFHFDISLSSVYYCEQSEKARREQDLISKINNDLFPKRGFVQISKDYDKLSNDTIHGGWDDERDRAFCKNFTALLP